MQELAGTLLAVKERPKVAKRPTIPTSAVPEKPAAKNILGFPLAPKPTVKPEPTQLSVPAQSPVEESIPAIDLLPRPSKNPDLSGIRPSAESVLSEIAPGTEAEAESKPKDRRIAFASTIPVKKPLVAKKPTIAAAKPRSDEYKSGKQRAGKAQPAQVVNAAAIPAGQVAVSASEPQAGAEAVTQEPRQARSLNWVPWIPIAAGIALASIAPQLHAFAAQWKPWGLRVLFPFVQLTALHEIGMSDELTRTMPQLMLYLQFPLEGLLVASNLRRGMRFAAAVGPIPGLHFVAGLVLWIVALGQVMPL